MKYKLTDIKRGEVEIDFSLFDLTKDLAILVDIDGTISDPSHRLHLVRETDKKDWDKFFELDKFDKPIKEPIDFLNKVLNEHMLQDIFVFVVTARPKRTRLSTKKWLEDHGIFADSIYMRDDNDYRIDYLVKEDMLKQIKMIEITPILALEDRPAIVDLYRRNGIETIQITNGDY